MRTARARAYSNWNLSLRLAAILDRNYVGPTVSPELERYNGLSLRKVNPEVPY